MKKSRINIFLVLIVFALSFNSRATTTVAWPTSPFNGLKVKDTVVNYSFLVSGHFHGASTSASTYPASTLLANIDTLNSLNPLFLMSLGDLFLDVNETYIDHYQKSLFSKLKMPLFNAVGNHDLANGNMYEKVYGKTWTWIIYKNTICIILNTEINDGSIKGNQFEFLKNILQQDQMLNGKNLFIFSHRPIWSEGQERYKGLFEGNTRTVVGSNNYKTEIEPLLLKAKAKNIYWISGSMSSAPVSFFYDKHPESGIIFMQTAIRDLPRDAVLQVNVEGDKISFKGVSLTGQTLEPIENYNLDFWKKARPEAPEFSFRMLPYLIKKMLLHHYFWGGFICAIVFVMTVYRIIARRKLRA